MTASRSPFFLLGAALFSLSLTLAPTPSLACEGEEHCSCGAACPNKEAAAGATQDGNAKAGGCAQDGGKCACAGKAAKGEAAAPADADKHEGHDHGGQPGTSAKQRAVIDPATGQLIAPSDEDAAALAEPAKRSAEAAPMQVAQGGSAGVMAAVPDDKGGKAVATVDGSGKVHASCAE